MSNRLALLAAVLVLVLVASVPALAQNEVPACELEGTCLDASEEQEATAEQYVESPGPGQAPSVPPPPRFPARIATTTSTPQTPTTPKTAYRRPPCPRLLRAVAAACRWPNLPRKLSPEAGTAVPIRQTPSARSCKPPETLGVPGRPQPPKRLGPRGGDRRLPDRVRSR